MPDFNSVVEAFFVVVFLDVDFAVLAFLVAVADFFVVDSAFFATAFLVEATVSLFVDVFATVFATTSFVVVFEFDLVVFFGASLDAILFFIFSSFTSFVFDGIFYPPK